MHESSENKTKILQMAELFVKDSLAIFLTKLSLLPVCVETKHELIEVSREASDRVTTWHLAVPDRSLLCCESSQ